MSKFWEKFFYILTAIVQGSSFLRPRAYALMHRLHHAYADTEKDPHSPKYSKNVFSMMWQTRKVYNSIRNDKFEFNEKFKDDFTYWPIFEKIVDTWAVRIFWMIVYLLVYIKYNTVLWLYLLLPFHFLMSPIHGAIINWYSHIYGYVNFKLNDTSKNLLPFDFLMMGEGYHNNHHFYGSRANFGIRWYEFDVTFAIICLFNLIGIIKVKNADNRLSTDVIEN